MSEQELLKIGALAEEAGVSVGTVKHYLREGLLPGPRQKSRNMAYYPREYVDRIALIKRLQDERYMPLKAIRRLLDEDADRIRAVLEIEDRILARSQRADGEPITREQAIERYGVPAEVLQRLESIGILDPGETGTGEPEHGEAARGDAGQGEAVYSALDVKVIEAISRFRASGYDEGIGFTVYDTLRYRRALEDLVAQEVEIVMSRLAGEVEPERVTRMLEAGAEPLEDLIAALHTKLLLEELQRYRGDPAIGDPRPSERR